MKARKLKKTCKKKEIKKKEKLRLIWAEKMWIIAKTKKKQSTNQKKNIFFENICKAIN